MSRYLFYPGCSLEKNARPYLDSLMAVMDVLGMSVEEVADWNCCGGHMTQISEASAYEIIRRLIHAASTYKADILVTLCPMCQLNLDVFQVEMNKFFKTSYHVPIVYFTQLMGLAYGKDPAELGFGKEFVDARPALARIGVELPAEADAAGPREKRAALPMPQMPGGEEAHQ